MKLTEIPLLGYQTTFIELELFFSDISLLQFVRNTTNTHEYLTVPSRQSKDMSTIPKLPYCSQNVAENPKCNWCKCRNTSCTHLLLWHIIEGSSNLQTRIINMAWKVTKWVTSSNLLLNSATQGHRCYRHQCCKLHDTLISQTN